MISEEDDRIQAIRCRGCHRLRPYPVDGKTFFCGCGGRDFVSSFPHPDEEKLALKLYERQIEERNLWRKLL